MGFSPDHKAPSGSVIWLLYESHPRERGRKLGHGWLWSRIQDALLFGCVRCPLHSFPPWTTPRSLAYPCGGEGEGGSCVCETGLGLIGPFGCLLAAEWPRLTSLGLSGNERKDFLWQSWRLASVSILYIIWTMKGVWKDHGWWSPAYSWDTGVRWAH